MVMTVIARTIWLLGRRDHRQAFSAIRPGYWRVLKFAAIQCRQLKTDSRHDIDSDHPVASQVGHNPGQVHSRG
jgi:hypothetical protein